MIIAFDGNVFSGKTSLITSLSAQGIFNMIGEHNNFLETSIVNHKTDQKDQAMLQQLKYLDAEKRRCENRRKDEVNLLDRSFISMAAHVFALNCISNIDIRKWFLIELKKRMRLGQVLIPDIFCFVECDHEVIKERVLKSSLKRTDPVYYEKVYLEAIEHFNRMWAVEVNSITVDTSTVLPITLLQTLRPQILVGGQEKSDKQFLCRVLEDVFAQRDLL